MKSSQKIRLVGTVDGAIDVVSKIGPGQEVQAALSDQSEKPGNGWNPTIRLFDVTVLALQYKGFNCVYHEEGGVTLKPSVRTDDNVETYNLAEIIADLRAESLQLASQKLHNPVSFTEIMGARASVIAKKLTVLEQAVEALGLNIESLVRAIISRKRKAAKS